MNVIQLKGKVDIIGVCAHVQYFKRFLLLLLAAAADSNRLDTRIE